MESNRRILVIDDDTGIQDAYRQILEPDSDPHGDELLASSGRLFGEEPDHSASLLKPQPLNEVTICSNGEDGIRTASEAIINGRPFAMAFVDMKMPGIDGATTAREIFKLDPQIRIVIVTAFSECSPDEIVEEVGREDIFYLNKPFNQAEIKQFTRALLDQWNINCEKEKLRRALEDSNRQLRQLTENLEEKVKEKTALLIQSEKLASVGLLAAGVAHEINNPAAFVGCNLNTIKRYTNKIVPLLELCRELVQNRSPEILLQLEHFLTNNKIEFILDDLRGLVDESQDGIGRISGIVADLKAFSHIDRAEISLVNVNEVIDTTLNIIHNQLKYKVEVIKQYGELPLIECFPQKISQVFMNLLINASQAIAEKGQIRICSQLISEGRRLSDQMVEIEISDTGQGIAPEMIPKLFDPFFTTKPVGEGTGLGLSIVYDIVKGHGGTIAVQSQLGKGSVFTLHFPVKPKFSALEGNEPNDQACADSSGR